MPFGIGPSNSMQPQVQPNRMTMGGGMPQNGPTMGGSMGTGQPMPKMNMGGVQSNLGIPGMGMQQPNPNMGGMMRSQVQHGDQGQYSPSQWQSMGGGIGPSDIQSMIQAFLASGGQTSLRSPMNMNGGMQQPMQQPNIGGKRIIF